MKYVILGAPATKKNSQRIARRRDGRPFILQSERHNDWAEHAVLQLKVQAARHLKAHPACVPVGIHVNLEAHVYRMREGGDLLNYLAAVSDALEHAGIVENDRLIASVDRSRLHIDRENPRVELELLPA